MASANKFDCCPPLFVSVGNGVRLEVASVLVGTSEVLALVGMVVAVDDSITVGVVCLVGIFESPSTLI